MQPQRIRALRYSRVLRSALQEVDHYLSLLYTMGVQRTAGPVAQWLERPAHNRLVAGSSPAGPTSHGASRPHRLEA